MKTGYLVAPTNFSYNDEYYTDEGLEAATSSPVFLDKGKAEAEMLKRERQAWEEMGDQFGSYVGEQDIDTEEIAKAFDEEDIDIYDWVPPSSLTDEQLKVLIENTGITFWGMVEVQLLDEQGAQPNG